MAAVSKELASLLIRLVMIKTMPIHNQTVPEGALCFFFIIDGFPQFLFAFFQLPIEFFQL